MNDPTMANPSPQIPLSSQKREQLLAICQQTLAAHPEISPWLQAIPTSDNQSLPFLPIRCFRLLSVSRFPEQSFNQSLVRTFRSSGSTNVTRASHHLGTTGWKSYQSAAVIGFQHAARRLGIPLTTPIVSLVPPESTWPESSLAAMMSFWKVSGLHVHFVDIESHPENLKKFLETELAEPNDQPILIFGTSLHHLTVCHWQLTHNNAQHFINNRKVWFFDTGGTKGRTLDVKQNDLQAFMRLWVAPHAQVSFLSEYGMCELSSQAYTVEGNHRGIFECSPTLKVVCISADFNSFCAPGEPGFLGFIDEANVDSWPFIVSEDLGTLVDDGLFQRFSFIGRAPDATLKGCSLNVRSNFKFSLSELAKELKHEHEDSNETRKLKEQNKQVAKNQTENRHLFLPHELLSHLNTLASPSWNQPLLDDLTASLVGWNNSQKEEQLKHQNALKNSELAIIASANIPITWLFPAAHAWLMSAKNINIYLPSLRPEDPISGLVREQIKTLGEAFNQCTNQNFIRIFHDRLPNNANCDVLLIFGNDDTIENIQNQLKADRRHMRLIGFGHYRNSCIINERESAESFAQATQRWFGRGCLTPMIARVPSNWTSQDTEHFARKWVKAAARITEGKKPTQYREQLRKQFQFSHRHNLAELHAVIRSHHLDARVYEDIETATVCVDLQRLSAIDIESTKLSSKILDWAGSGWLTLVSLQECPEPWQKVPTESCTPTLWDTHQGKHWVDWLS